MFSGNEVLSLEVHPWYMEMNRNENQIILLKIPAGMTCDALIFEEWRLNV